MKKEGTEMTLSNSEIEIITGIQKKFSTSCPLNQIGLSTWNERESSLDRAYSRTHCLKWIITLDDGLSIESTHFISRDVLAIEVKQDKNYRGVVLLNRTNGRPLKSMELIKGQILTKKEWVHCRVSYTIPCFLTRNDQEKKMVGLSTFNAEKKDNEWAVVFYNIDGNGFQTAIQWTRGGKLLPQVNNIGMETCKGKKYVVVASSNHTTICDLSTGEKLSEFPTLPTLLSIRYKVIGPVACRLLSETAMLFFYSNVRGTCDNVGDQTIVLRQSRKGQNGSTVGSRNWFNDIWAPHERRIFFWAHDDSDLPDDPQEEDWDKIPIMVLERAQIMLET